MSGSWSIVVRSDGRRGDSSVSVVKNITHEYSKGYVILERGVEQPHRGLKTCEREGRSCLSEGWEEV